MRRQTINKIVSVMVLLIVFLFLITGCGNKDWWDTQYTFKYAYCYYDNTVTSYKLDKWTDFEDGDQLQLELDNGNVILVHASRCMLSEKAMD